jgi:SAM-dependent methyltransferase
MTLAVGRLIAAGSGRQLGSVFAVTRHLALTAFHCVHDDDTDPDVITRVRCIWQHGTSDAILQAWDEYDDVALLRLSRPLPDSFDPVPLTSDVASNDPFVAPGAPVAMAELHLAAVSGMVIWPDAPMANGGNGISLVCWQVMAGLSLHGLSGAPALTGNMEKAVGVIRWNPPQAENQELARGAEVYAAPAGRILERWPELSLAANLPELVRQLADRRRARDTAGVYANVRALLLSGDLNLGQGDLRIIPAPEDGRSGMIAVDAGQTVISVESGLAHAAVRAVAERELADAVLKRSDYAGQRYAALLTDGISWFLYHVLGRKLELVDAKTADPAVPRKLLDWLEAIMATGRNIAPDRDIIESKLGAQSPAYKLDAAELTSIYQANREVPTVKVKRRMWAKLLTTASGTSFADNDLLFINHTLLVATAKVIGHAVLDIRLDEPEITARALMSGVLFTQAQITGVVEDDFFGWIIEVPEGDQFVKALARRLCRFNWRQVKHDVLKHLYESIIPQATRHQLGEYYTPDWLAEAIIDETVQDPLNQRVLDASCGSGTFLFHAIRSYLTEAENECKTTGEAISGLVTHVIGIDVHPVAVALARVTYLLAIGNLRLQDRPAFTVPVFLGDSLRWGQEFDLLTYDYEGLSVSTRLDPDSFVTGAAAPSQPEFAEQLNFPDSVVADTARFDLLVAKLAHRATSREPKSPVPPLDDVFEMFGIHKDDRGMLKQTFTNMCHLHDDEKDHIWGYYVRNLARPAWLARSANRVDVLVGNPPWLVYRCMTKPQQISFSKMSSDRGLWAGGTAATSQELAALFVARCIELYLKPGGQFGYVMPWSVLPRPGQQARGRHAGFRSGNYGTGAELVNVAFTQTWDLHQVKPSFFPLAVGVIFGRRQEPDAGPVPMPERSKVMTGRFDTQAATWAEAERSISVLDSEPWSTARHSPYADRFSAGATVFPRVLFLVEPDRVPFGQVAGQRPVRSRRSPRERKPWKHLRELHGAVEEEFILPLLLGESILPFRCLEPLGAVIPWDGQRLLGLGDALLGRHPGLADWWHKAEAAWTEHRSDRSQHLSLKQRLDYHRDLSHQFPVSQYRVVYSASGTYLAAATLTNSSAIIEHKLYWAPVASRDEAQYLTAILNSTVLTAAVGPMQARGEHNARDFDKYVFQIPIPLYDPEDAEHARLVVLAEKAERVAGAIKLPDVRFERQRKYIRDALELDGVGTDINAIVKSLLDLSV